MANGRLIRSRERDLGRWPGPYARHAFDRDGDPSAGILRDGITALSRYHSLFVIARNSSFTYKGRAVDQKQVGRELGVAA